MVAGRPSSGTNRPRTRPPERRQGPHASRPLRRIFTCTYLATIAAAAESPLTTPTPSTSAQTPVAADMEAVELAPGLELLSYRFVYSGIYRADSVDKAT